MAGNLDDIKKFPIFGRMQLIGGLAIETLAADKVIDSTYGNLLKLDPGGAHRNVTLPDDDGNGGDFFFIVNGADAAENLVVKNSAGSTIGTLNQNEAGLFGCATGGSAWGCLFVMTIALA